MSEVKTRKVHTPEFKAKVGLEALRGVKTIMVYRTALGGGAKIVEKFARAREKPMLRYAPQGFLPRRSKIDGARPSNSKPDKGKTGAAPSRCW